jgi:hypothetical protein
MFKGRMEEGKRVGNNIFESLGSFGFGRLCLERRYKSIGFGVEVEGWASEFREVELLCPRRHCGVTALGCTTPLCMMDYVDSSL